MNLIWICADTFRGDHLGCMGHPRVKTPNLDRLASDGILFENAYSEGLPTGPERTVFMTGRFTLPYHGWVPLRDDDVTLAEHLGRKGYRTALMCDCPHFFKANCNYHRGFKEFRWIRGQEADLYATANKGRDAWCFMPARTNSVPLAHKKNGQAGADRYLDPLRQYLRNTAERGEEEADFFPGQTCGAAMKWLEDNRDAKDFLLWIEMFDPHEPWDPPKKYADMYRNPAYKGPMILSPWFHSTLAKDFTPEELEDIRACYMAEVTLVDDWVGRLLAKVDALGLRDNTAIVFVSDHGTLLGERGFMGKNPTIGVGVSRFVCNQALIIRHPQGPMGARVKPLVWSPDYMPACCEMLGVAPPATIQGRSFWKMAAEGDRSLERDHIVSGRHGAGGYHYVVDERWSFVPRTKRNEDELYERASDPTEAGTNVAREHPDVCDRLHALAEKHVSARGKV